MDVAIKVVHSLVDEAIKIPLTKMSGISSQPCQTCRRQIKDAGIFAGKINCEDCARAIRTPRPRPPQRSCACCKKTNQLNYEAKIQGFYLCDRCSGRAQSYLDNENYSGLEVMAAAIKSNGYTVPQDYLDALDKVKKAVQRTAAKSIQCDGCYRRVEVPYSFEASNRFLCDECAEDFRDYRRQMLQRDMSNIRRGIRGIRIMRMEIMSGIEDSDDSDD